MSLSGLSACSGAPAPAPFPHGPDSAARQRRAQFRRSRGRGHGGRQRFPARGSPWRRRRPPGSPQPAARPVKDTGSGGGGGARSSGTRAHRAARGGTAVTWRGTGGGAAGRLRSASASAAAASGLSAADLSLLRLSPEPSSVISVKGSPRSATSGANRFGYFRPAIGER